MTDSTQLTLCSAPDMDDDAVFVCYYGVETHGTSRCADPSVANAGWQLQILCSATHPSGTKSLSGLAIGPDNSPIHARLNHDWEHWRGKDL